MLSLENDFDKTIDKTRSLENWIDIYMPLRLQHQITETIKECLSRKGKYLLGVVDNLMCNELRERVFKDVGVPQLQERCLEVIEKLKLEAKILTEENWQQVKEVEHNFTKWGGKEIEDRQLQSGVVEVDVQQHLGDSDAEMVALIKGQLEKYIKTEIDGAKDWMTQKFKEFETQTSQQLEAIESLINSKSLDSGHFQMALKTEIEQVGEYQRKQNIENLAMMKNFSTTLKQLKESSREFRVTEI